jgi:hypothetical protein
MKTEGTDTVIACILIAIALVGEQLFFHSTFVARALVAVVVCGFVFVLVVGGAGASIEGVVNALRRRRSRR